jgi:membrane protein
VTLFPPLPLTWQELARRTYQKAADDNFLDLAAQLSYYFFLALFPAILFLLAVASFFPLQNLTDNIGSTLGTVVSPEVSQLIQDQMQRLGNAQSGGLLTFGVLAALWSSSSALVSIVAALNRAYDITEGRPWWKVRMVAIGLTVGAALLVLIGLSLVLGGPAVATYLGDTLGWGALFKWTWLILQWPLVFAMISTAIGLVYYFGPDAEQDWAWVSPGALVATILWLVVSLAFKVYVAKFTDYNASYGAVGGVIVMLLWFYISGIALIIGAETAKPLDKKARTENACSEPGRRARSRSSRAHPTKAPPRSSRCQRNSHPRPRQDWCSPPASFSRATAIVARLITNLIRSRLTDTTSRLHLWLKTLRFVITCCPCRAICACCSSRPWGWPGRKSTPPCNPPCFTWASPQRRSSS